MSPGANGVVGQDRGEHMPSQDIFEAKILRLLGGYNTELKKPRKFSGRRIDMVLWFGTYYGVYSSLEDTAPELSCPPPAITLPLFNNTKVNKYLPVLFILVVVLHELA